LLAASDTPVWITAYATVSLAIAACFGLRSLRDARKTRHGEVLTELSRRWDDHLVLKSLTLGRKYGPSGTLALVDALWTPGVTDRDERDLDDWYAISVYPNLLETIGVYLREGVISDSIVYRLWGANIISAWRDWKGTVEALRDATGEPDVWIHFERLASKMQARMEWERLGQPRTIDDRIVLVWRKTRQIAVSTLWWR
jgi:hypothetical protein